MSEKKKIIIEKNGPYHVEADIPLDKELIVADENNDPLTWKKKEKIATEGAYDLCRCGQSQSKPFCDGSHKQMNFGGVETASKEPYIQQADTIPGPKIDLLDAKSLCARARFCHRCGGTWSLTENSDNPKAKEISVQQACDCPSGRLTAIDKNTGQAIEPEFVPSISVTEDVPMGVGGPLWVKGGIEVESVDGTVYEARNRQTLCRCGRSRNKPFCDGSHCDIGFDDTI